MDTLEATTDPIPDTRRGWGRAVAYVLIGVWLWLALWGMAAGGLGALWPGVDAWVITSASMEPALSPGDLLLTVPPDPEVTYDAPTIITVHDGERHVTHRITEVVEGRYVTRGDANSEPDPVPVDPEEVVGIGRLVIPWVGLPIHWWLAGQWGWVVLAALTVVGAAGLRRRLIPGGTGEAAPSRASVVAFVALATALAAVGVTTSAFAATTAEAGSVGAAPDFGRGPYDQMILADGPAAYWRLGETGSAGGATFVDDFATFTGWSDNPQGGTVVAATPPSGSPSGGGGGLKDTNNDPAGAGKALGFSTDDFTMTVWVHRPTPIVGGAADRISVETAGGDGYGFILNHSNDTVGIERRTGGSAAASSGTVGLVDPLDVWYRVVLTKAGSGLSLDLYDSGGGVLAQQTWTDAAHAGAFTHVRIRGGNEYYVDDIEVVQGASGVVTAVDTSGNGNDGTYANPIAPASGLIVDPDTGDGSIDFSGGAVLVPDSSDINLGGRDERTLSVWFEASTNGRQLIYEEGGGTNGLNAYLDGSTLYARAWNSDWSPGELQVTSVVTSGTHHLAMVLDAPGDILSVYLDGVLVGAATKTDGRDWNSHSDDTGIGRVNGGTKFHDGNSSAPTPFTGRIDEVAVFNVALGPAQVVEHWANGTG